MFIVLTTTPNYEEADRMAHSIVENKLAACVQILPKMTSVYFWEGKIQKEPELLLMIKTLEEKFDELSEFIRKNHSYDVPEIVAIESEKLSGDYLKWLTDSVC